MVTFVDRAKFRKITALFDITFARRLGGIAGLLGVALGLVLGFDLVNPSPALEKILQVLPNLAVIVWLVGVAAVQSPRGRPGSWGVGAAMAGLSAVTVFNLLLHGAHPNVSDRHKVLLDNRPFRLFNVPWEKVARTDL